VISLKPYNLDSQERETINNLLSPYNYTLSLEALWALMDQAWHRHSCNNKFPNLERLACFYRDPVWLLNGIFIESHDLSMRQRRCIAAYAASLNPLRLVDVGGGFGTLARLLAQSIPSASIDICDPFPPEHGLVSCQAYPSIRFISSLPAQSYDVLVSTDVLEHLLDPLTMLAEMINAVKPGGYLIIANCFYPVIACHLPATFHLRYTFDLFCEQLGLRGCGPCPGSHATVYQRVKIVDPNWLTLRSMEKRSQRFYLIRNTRDSLFSLPKRAARKVYYAFKSIGP
jgi:ubiquinone/menaquinone biosynthesis C-methylase UbiE